jgi:predicted aldo/keto reductase-like oxidoreductase
MQYRKFGKLDWQASALGFGCMRLPVIDGKSDQIDEAEATRMIRFAIDNGVTYFDTAYGYHGKMSEIVVGKALNDGYRQKVHLATKLPMWIVTETADYDRLLNEQLKKLQTDHVDFYLFHGLNRGTWEKVVNLNLIKCAEAAKADGRIRHIGFSFHDDLDAFKTIVDSYSGWDMCQIQYNFMDIENQAGTAGLQYAAARGLGVVIMEPLLGGKLARTVPAVEKIWDLAEIRRKPADWALQWLWSQPEVSVVLSGMSAMTQVEENIGSAAVSAVGMLRLDELELVARARDTYQGLSPIPCTKCEYCLPCPNGVAIPRNFAVYNEGVMFNNQQGASNDYKRWIPDEAKASQCIACQECETKCPQNIPISQWMPLVDAALGEGKPFAMHV